MRAIFIQAALLYFLGAIVVGVLTGFRYNALGGYPADSYHSLPSGQAIFYLTAVFVIWRYGYALLGLITRKYRVIALMFVIFNPLVGLAVGLGVYFVVQKLISLEHSGLENGHGAFAGFAYALIILMGTLVVQVAAEVRALKCLREVFR